MPTVLSDEGFAVRVYLNDHEPAHVHVWKGGGWILLSLPTERISVAVLRTSGMKQADMVRAVRLVERNAATLWTAWRRYHGQKAE